MKTQHLVLDDDVHKALKAHKRRTGVRVKEIGNSALRAALAVPTQEELLVEKLVQTGKLTHKDYQQAASAATRALKALHAQTGKEIVPSSAGKLLPVGSWTGKTLHLSEDGAFAVFLHWARDGKRTPSPLHHHEKSHTWTHVLEGQIACRIGTETIVLEAHESVHIPPEVPHNSAPLTQNTAILMLLAPPETTPRAELGERPTKTPRRTRTRRKR